MTAGNNTMQKTFKCPISKLEEKYLIPKEESKRFEIFVRDINHQIDICSYGLMYTLIEFTDAFSKYMIK